MFVQDKKGNERQMKSEEVPMTYALARISANYKSVINILSYFGLSTVVILGTIYIKSLKHRS